MKTFNTSFKDLIKDLKVTEIQFFDYSNQFEVETEIHFFDYPNQFEVETENRIELETVRNYSANVVFNDKFIVQLSGNDDEAHKAYVPNSYEQYHNDEEFQDLIADHEYFDYDLIKELLEKNEIANNFDFLNDY